jgi:hypothetical protein
LADEELMDQFNGHIDELRRNPQAYDSATEQARAAPEKLAAEIEKQLEHNSSKITELRAARDNSAMAYSHVLQTARAKPPPLGFKSLLDLTLFTVGTVLLDGGIATVTLMHALGALPAIVSGLGFAAISVVLGMVAAYVLLRSADHQRDTAQHRRAKWVIAIFIGILALFILYAGACYRAAWVDGLDGGPDDLIANFESPVKVLLHSDVLLLLALGIAGFFIGAVKCFRFYHGFGYQLRDAGLAAARADAELREAAAELKVMVSKSASDMETELDEIKGTSQAWTYATAERSDGAQGDEQEHHRRLDLIRRSVAGIVTEYTDGYYEVSPFERTTYTSNIAIGADIDVPGVFQAAREAAIEGAQAVAVAIRQACLMIAKLVSEAIRRIDELAGLRGRSPSRTTLPSTRDRP